jgi:ABC-type Fe3+/spermidine/putrescine transport system ATPase subunit
MVFQNYALFPHLNVFENVAFGLRARHKSKEEMNERVNSALELVQLPGYGKRAVDELSGGQQQRVAIARAIAIEPVLLLFDEPLSNLDVSLRESTRSELRELVTRLGLTAVYVTHDQEEAFALCDRISVMVGGKLMQTGRHASSTSNRGNLRREFSRPEQPDQSDAFEFEQDQRR